MCKYWLFIKKNMLNPSGEFVLYIGRSSKRLGNMTDNHAIPVQARASQPRIGVKICMKII